MQEFDTIGKPKMVNPELYTGSTVLFESFSDMKKAQRGKYEGIAYGTDRLPNQRGFEEALCTLEGGSVTRAFQSGINAIENILFCFTRTGDHVLICENVYGPTAAFCKKILAKFGVNFDFYPGNCGAEIDNYIKPETCLIFMESPGSNTFEIQDIPSITEVAQQHDIITVLDNTWATPVFLKPFDLGVDVTIQSVTKYISGHSDVLLGTATANSRYGEPLAKFYRAMELFASPQDCYLALRGLQTLDIRLRQHQQSALEIARWLLKRPEVDLVLHPALESHPQHAIWKRDFSGSSGIFSFSFHQEPDDDEIESFVDSLDMFGLGFSWGGFKSLVTAGRYQRQHSPEIHNKMLVRLNIGLEDVNSLKEDLDKGFAAMKLLTK